jgi:hypothetical protein
VDVPEELVQKHAQDVGNKGRVVALALELEALATEDWYSRVVCIADADLGHCNGTAPQGRLLVLTEHSSVDIYLLDERPIAKFLSLVVQRPGLEAQAVLRDLLPVLNELFSVRLAARELDVSLPMLDFRRTMEVGKGQFRFDADEYAKRFIRRGGYARLERAFLEVIARFRAAAVDKELSFAHGHDFAAALHWYLDKVMRVPNLPDSAYLAKSLRGCLEREHIEEAHIISELRSRFGGPPDSEDAARSA